MNQANLSQSLTPIISEEEFLPIAREASVDFLSLLAAAESAGGGVNKLFYFTLLKEAENLENLLDDHGARSNLKYLFFAEQVACVRNFCLAGFQLCHILDRYNDYLSSSRNNVRLEFEKEAQDTLAFILQTIFRFNQSLLEEAKSLGMDISFKKISPDAWVVKAVPKLPFTIGGVEAANPVERIISLAQSYRRTHKQFRQQGLHRRLKASELSEIIPSKINETIMADFESQLHSIQSEYDTHVKGSLVERENPWMATLRGLTAIPMHMFESLAWLIHFYERHINLQRGGHSGERIAALVDKQALFKAITGFGLIQCGAYLAEGNEVAERILSMYVTPITYELPLPVPHGFHARPAKYIGFIIQEHGTDAFLLFDGKKFNCRSVMELMEAGGLLADHGAKTVLFEGDKRCLDDIKILAESNYCEDKDIPQELNYLRILRNM